jgi:hypothetical protein
MFAGITLGKTFESKSEAHGVASRLSKTVPESPPAIVVRANAMDYTTRAAMQDLQVALKHAKRNLRMISAPGYAAEAGYTKEQVKAFIARDRALVKSIQTKIRELASKAKNPTAFDRCVESVTKKGTAVSPRGVCAAAGRKKYGKKKFQEMALAGKRAKRNSDIVDRVKQQIVELEDRYRVHPTKAAEKSLDALRLKFARLTGARKNATDFSLYDKAKAADDAFQAALVKQYGGRAGDMRYQSAKHPAHIKALAKAKKKADERWLAEMRRGNPKLLTSIGQGSARADVYALKGSAHQVRMRGEAPKDFGSKDAAMKYARLRVHELAKNPATGLATAEQMVAGKQSLTSKLMRKLTGKKNPEGSAEEMYQIFHGLPTEKVIEYREKVHVHEWLWAVGTLSSLHVSNGKQKVVLSAPDPNTNPFEDVVMVCMTEDGKQFHFRGGDQSLPLDGIAEAFELTEDDVREHMEIGRILQMTYRTRKIFEDKGKVNIDFYHDLGKEHAKNKLPLLMYRPLNPSMDVVGGRYKVAPLDKSIQASPGVVG